MSTLEQLAEETGLSISQVRTAIKKLKQTNDLETTSSNRSTLFCVVNYDVYQNIDKKETDEVIYPFISFPPYLYLFGKVSY